LAAAFLGGVFLAMLNPFGAGQPAPRQASSQRRPSYQSGSLAANVVWAPSGNAVARGDYR
jgi:hypothetical protein